MANEVLTAFFSQPFHGRSEKDIMEDRTWLALYLTQKYNHAAYIIDQYHQNKPRDAGVTWYLANDIRMLGEADLVVFHPDWQGSSGCRIEMDVVEKFDLPHIILPPDWLDKVWEFMVNKILPEEET